MSETAEFPETKKSQAAVVGIRPRLPWPLSRMKTWNEPVPAERLAVLRIGMSAILLLDVILIYFPNRETFFGRDSLGRPEVFQHLYKTYWNWEAPRNDLENLVEDLSHGDPFRRSLERRWRWSLLYRVEDPRIIEAAMIVWIAATIFLFLGLGTRVTAIVVWL